MVRKLIFLFLAIPVAVVLILLSVANRFPVTLSLDPFAPETPAVAVTLPFFVFLFLALMVGLLIGGIATWWRQGFHRKRARDKHNQAVRWQSEADVQKKRAEELAAEKTNDVLGLPTNKAA